ncbi:hypothetical protein M3Y97_00430100 [Aphelenchoides bicaudatus]|nr:hypothetical protein M3Y97_00430100 [Aphelenchoides bicaudatus]
MSAENPMKAYIEKELKQRSAEEVTELLLDNCTSKQIVGLEGHAWPSLNHLSFVTCGLESLDGLVELPTVRVLDVSENKITNLEKIPECLANLYHLNICDNPLETVEQLAPLKKLTNLQALDIFDCPLADNENHRALVFEAIPNLKFLNGFDINDEEADDLTDGGESAMGEAGGFEDADSDIEDEEGEIVGLDYLNSSKALNETDDSKDYVDKLNGNTKKRKANGHSAEEPEKKKAAEEA